MPALERLYQPEYVGENRCLPCTGLNLGIAIVITIVLVELLHSLLIPATVLVLSLATIYFRGYLVPGTPELTKRYLSERVLGWFGKAPAHSSPAFATESGADEIDAERLLTAADAIEPCEVGSDLCLTESFERAWHDRIEARRSGATNETHLAAALGVPEDSDIRVMADGDSFVALNGIGTVAQWSSQAAAIADIAAADVLDGRLAGWDRLAPAEKAGVLASLRIFLDHCPACGGPIEAGEEQVSSCCHSYQVFAISCANCDSRLYEANMEHFAETAN